MQLPIILFCWARTPVEPPNGGKQRDEGVLQQQEGQQKGQRLQMAWTYLTREWNKVASMWASTPYCSHFFWWFVIRKDCLYCVFSWACFPFLVNEVHVVCFVTGLVGTRMPWKDWWCQQQSLSAHTRKSTRYVFRFLIVVLVYICWEELVVNTMTHTSSLLVSWISAHYAFVDGNS